MGKDIYPCLSCLCNSYLSFFLGIANGEVSFTPCVTNIYFLTSTENKTEPVFLEMIPNMLYEFLLFGHKAPPLVCRLYQGEYAESIYIFWDSFRVINIDMNNEIEKIIRGEGEDADNAFGEWYSEQRRSGGKLTTKDHNTMAEIRDRRKARLAAQKAALSDEKSKNLKEHFKNRILNEAYRKPRFGDSLKQRLAATVLGTALGAMYGNQSQMRSPVHTPQHAMSELTPRGDEYYSLYVRDKEGNVTDWPGRHGLDPRERREIDKFGDFKPGTFGALGGAGAYLAALINKLRPHSNKPKYRRMSGDLYLPSGTIKKKPDPNVYIPPERSFTPNNRTWSKPAEPGPRVSNMPSSRTGVVKVYSKPTEPREGIVKKLPIRPMGQGPADSSEVAKSILGDFGMPTLPTRQGPADSSEVAKSILGDFGMPALPTSSASVPSSWFPRSDSPPTTTTPTINPTVSDEPTSPTRTPAAGTGSAGQPSTPTETPDEPKAGEPTIRDVLKQALMRKLTGKGRSGKRPSV